MSGKNWLAGMLVLVAACTGEVKKQQVSRSASDTTLQTRATPQKTHLAKLYKGNYITGEYPSGYYQLQNIEEKPGNEYAVRFSASQVKGKEVCHFQGTGFVVNDTLKVPLEWNSRTVQMTLYLHNDTMVVFTENFDDRFALNYYCSGGASLTGDYARARK